MSAPDCLHIRHGKKWDYCIRIRETTQSWYCERQLQVTGNNPYKWEDMKQDSIPRVVAQKAVEYWEEKKQSGQIAYYK